MWVCCQNHKHFERPIPFSRGLIKHLDSDKLKSISSVTVMAEYFSHQMSEINLCQVCCYVGIKSALILLRMAPSITGPWQVFQSGSLWHKKDLKGNH